MNTKKPLSILLTLALVLGLLPWTVMPARAADVTEIEITSWAALKGNSSAAEVTTTNGVTTVKLKACIKLTAELEIALGESGERPYVLDLNGYGIRYAGDANASVIRPNYRCSSLTLKDSATNPATYYITLANGRGTAVSDGGTVSFDASTGNGVIAVTGGYITGGKASTGGGVNITTPFTMEGGTICGNKASSSGGVRAKDFTMSGGTISYNSATSDAGGVNISTKGTAVMTGGTIAHNSGPYTDVYNAGTFVITGGTIGYEGQSGKSIYNTLYSAFYSKSGSSARCYGNFEVDYGKPAQTISTVTASAANGTVAVSSDPAWTDETTGYYAERDTVTLTVTPDAGYQLDTLTVKDASSNNVEVGGTGNTRTFTMPAENVTVSATFAALPVAQVNETPYTTVQDAINAASSDYENSAGTVTLLADVTVDEPLTIASGKYVTLNLAGHTIDRGLAGQSATNSGSVIEVYGSLTLKDPAGGGTITGGNENNFGGGVYVNAGTFTMQGGTITGNQGGGGVYIDEGGTFNMTGGTITGNNAPGFGGGVCVSEGCTFNVSGSPVISGNWTEGKWDAGSARYVRDEENNNSAADDVQLSATNTSRTYITVTGALTSGASIYVNRNAEAGIAFAQADNYTIRETDAVCFHSDVGDSLAGVLEGTGVMFKKSLTEGMIGAIADQTYSGSAITPDVTVEDNSNALTLGEDYTVSYSNNVNAAESTAASAPTVTVTGKGGYTGTASKTFTINKKPVTVSGLTAKDKVYDGTTAATLVTTAATFGGICEGDTLAVTATGAFENANAGENKTVNISNLTLGGASAANYVLATDGQQESATATISQKPVTVSGITAKDKEYDDTTTATLVTTTATFDGICDGDTLTVTATGAFADADKGENKAVSISNLTLGGASAANYVLATDGQQESATASITGIQVYIDGVAASDKTYDGTDAATVTGTAALKKASNNEVVTGLTVSDITAKFADKNVGTGKTVTITGGTLSDTTNYTLVTSVTTGLTANITAKPVTITGLSAENKVYDGNTTATVTGTAVISGLVSGDTVTVTAGSAAFADKNAGDGKTVTFSSYSLSGTDAGNYALSAQPASVTAKITKANATCSTAPVAKTGLIYNGSAQALVTAGSATGGEMQYSLDGNTYGTGIPEGTDAKSYTVYYKVVGDENHNDVAPASIAVSIAKEDQLAPSLTSPVTIAAPATTAEITGVTTAMEYSTDNKTWTACASPFSFGKGVFYIRLAEDANHNASPAATVVVKKDGEHSLTVTGGTGSGIYEKDAQVSVSVTIPAGQKFKNWTAAGITLTDEQKAAASITVTMPDSDVTLTANFEDLTVTGITLNKTSLSLAPNAAATLTVSYQPSGVKDTYKGVTWTSSNESVATVDGSGEVTAKAEGTATITAKSTSNTSAEATCTVTVKKQSPTPTPTPSYDPTPSGRDDTPSTPSTTTDSTTTTNADGGKTESTSKTTETKNSDGSTTAKTTETATTTAADGSKTESKSETSTTTKANTDGTTTASTTATQTATTTDANGVKTTTETKTEAKETLDKSGNGTVEAKTTETVKDANGKVTETTVTESKGTVETAAGGAKTTTTTNTATTTDANGNKTTTVTTEQTVEKADGSTGSVVTNENGETVSATATISEKAVEQAQKSGDAVTVPVTVTATNDAATATAVEITVPQGAESVKVEIPVENVKPGTVAVIVNPNGSEEIVKTSTTSDEGVVLTLDAGATVKLVDNTKPMNDVKGDEWYADNIAWATSHEVMNGVGGGNFAPNDPTTQGMMEQLLYNLDGNAFVPAAEDEAWWSAADRWADGESVTQGLGDAHDPVAPATREVDALMMFNYAKTKGYDVSARADLSRFPDAANVNEEAREALAWAVAAGLINGTTDENGNVILDPQGVATRAQVSAIIERFCENVVK